MLLFDRKKALNQIMGPHPDHKADGGEVEHGEIHALANEAINAIHSKDAKGFAEATHAMFMHFDSMPHPEGEHE